MNTSPGLDVLCNLLGQIPLEEETYSGFKLPADWEALSARDWEQLISMAQDEGLGPLVYWALSRTGKNANLSETARILLHDSYAGTWSKNQVILHELESLAGIFKSAGIPLVVLKGACLALTVYPDTGLRPMGDLDVLVPVENGPAAVKIAKSLGYLPSEPEAAPGLNDLLSHHSSLIKSGSPSILLEIHTSLVADRFFRYSVPVDWFWMQVEPLATSLSKYDPLNLFMLSPTAQVLYAAAHAMLQHGGKIAPLVWFYDLDRLDRYYSSRMDWDLLLRQAHIFNWGSALQAALSKTVACFNTPIMGSALARLSGISDRHQELVALKQVEPATHVLEERQKLLSLEWHARIRLFLALIAPAPTYMRWRYRLKTPWLLPAFYLLRWAGIIADAGRTLLHLVKRMFVVSSPDNFSQSPVEKD